MIRILIGGDVCPMGKVQAAFTAGRSREIFHDLLPEIQFADLAIANLECPLVSQPSPIAKSGPVLGAPTECIHGFTDAQWDILNLANNHSFDHGAAGLRETIETVRKAGLTAIGAGMNLAEAQAPVVRVVEGQRVVIYSVAEREFSVADATTPGANPLDLINFVEAVRHHKQEGIFIVLVHGGKEYYPYPPPEMIRRCRFMVDMGADAVICCHTHCPLPWEIHAGRPIVYGMGNLVFEADGELLPSWHQGYLAQLLIEGKEVQLKPILYQQSLSTNGATAMDPVSALALHNDLLLKSAELRDPTLMESKWREYCRDQRTNYLSYLFAYPHAMHKLRRILLPFIHTRKELLRALLLVECETHREVLESLFKEERFRR
jgi:hypothetical protein